MTTPAADTNRIATFKLRESEYQRLEQLARAEDRSVSAVLRLAVRSYLDAIEERAA